MSQIYTFIIWVFGGIALLIGAYHFIDLILTSIYFIIFGTFESVLQKSIEFEKPFDEILGIDNWKINTGMIGLNKIVNGYIALQYSVNERWVMFGISLVISVFTYFLGNVFKLRFIEFSSNPKTPKDISFVGLISLFVVIILLAPVIYKGMVGIPLMIMIYLFS